MALAEGSVTGLRLAGVQLDFLPQHVTAQHNIWIPDEVLVTADPLAVPDLPQSLASLRRERDLRPAMDPILGSNRIMYEEVLRKRVSQILRYCVEHDADVVTFPECCIPASIVGPVLAQFSTELAVFAGIGLVRAHDLEFLPEAGDELVGRNCAVYISRGSEPRFQYVSKRHLAEGEKCEIGEGPLVVSISKGGRTFSAALCICMDALHLQPGTDSAPDLAITCALSRNVSEFLPRTPRSFGRFFVNHAFYGGTALSAPGIAGAAFVGASGTEPLPGQSEGVLIVDYDGFPAKPASLAPPHNAVVVRAPIVEGPSAEGATSLGADTASLLAMLSAPGAADSAAIDELDDRMGRLAGPRYRLLAELLGPLKSLCESGTLGRADLVLLTSTVRLTDCLTPNEVHYRRICHVQLQLREELATSTALADVWSAMLRARQALAKNVRPEHRIPSDRDAEFVSAQGATTFYSATLGQYSTGDAVHTLTSQLVTLRALARESRVPVEVIYRLTTSVSQFAELLPRFEVLGLARQAGPEIVEELAEGIGQQLGTSFGAWNISGSSATDQPPFEHQVWLVPRGEWRPTPQEDWAGLIDLLRSQQKPAALELRCRPASGTLPASGGPMYQAASGSEGYLHEEDRNAAQFLYRQLGVDDHLALELAIGLSSPDGVSESLVAVVAAQMLGACDYDILPALTWGGACTPAEALCVFHPPYGHIAGRGLTTRAPLSIPLPLVELAKTGSRIGSARSSSARADRHSTVRLATTDRLRHLYVIGKTGTGKTNLLKYLARQDIEAGHGVAVIDPHGDLVDYLLGVVGDRVDEVTLLDFGRNDFVPVLNPLDVGDGSVADQRLAIDEFIRLLQRQTFHEFYGPRFEDTIRMAIESSIRVGFTDVPSVLGAARILRSSSLRKAVRSKIEDDRDLKDRWDIFERQSDTARAELINWAVAKFGDMDRDGVLTPVLGGGRSTVSVSTIVSAGGILLVKLPEWQIGTAAAGFLGVLIQEQIRKAAFDRKLQAPDDDPELFHLFVDEFQKFATTGFDSLLAESRKFGLALVLAHQNLRQLEAFSKHTGNSSPQLLEALLGNVGNFVVFGVSSRDADLLAREIGVPTTSIERIGRYSALVRLLVGGAEEPAFTVDVPLAESNEWSPAARDRVIRQMAARGVWRPRAHVMKTLDEADREFTARPVGAEAVPPGAAGPPSPTGAAGTSFLDEWLARRKKAERFPNVERVKGVDTAAATRLRSAFASMAELADTKPKDIAARAEMELPAARRVAAWARRRLPSPS